MLPFKLWLTSQCFLTKNEWNPEECSAQPKLENTARSLISGTAIPFDINHQFEIKTKNVLRGLEAYRENKTLIGVRIVTDSNKHLIPPFEITGFEFFSFTQMRNRQFNRADFHNMLQRIAHDFETVIIKSAKARITPVREDLDRNNHEPMLVSIGDDFSERHKLPSMRIIRIRVSERGPFLGQDEETGLHFDRLQSDEEQMVRLWIPLTTSPGKSIDNRLLGVGDCSGIGANAMSVIDEQRVSDEGLKGVRWYQQSSMTEFDGIFYEGWRVPHFSDNNQDPRRRTPNHVRSRSAIVVDFGHSSLH